MFQKRPYQCNNETFCQRYVQLVVWKLFQYLAFLPSRAPLSNLDQLHSLQLHAGTCPGPDRLLYLCMASNMQIYVFPSCASLLDYLTCGCIRLVHTLCHCRFTTCKSTAFSPHQQPERDMPVQENRKHQILFVSLFRKGTLLALRTSHRLSRWQWAGHGGQAQMAASDQDGRKGGLGAPCPTWDNKDCLNWIKSLLRDVNQEKVTGNVALQRTGKAQVAMSRSVAWSQWSNNLGGVNTWTERIPFSLGPFNPSLHIQPLSSNCPNDRKQEMK